MTELSQITLPPELTSAIIEYVEQAEETEMKRRLNDFKIIHAADGRWECNYTDAAGRRRRIRKTTADAVQKELRKQLKEMEKGENEKEPEPEFTLRTLYPVYRDGLIAEGRISTAARYDYDWKRYLEDTALVRADITTLKTSELKKLLMELAGTVTQRKYRDLKTIINGVMDLAVEDDIIPVNVARNVRQPARDHFQQAADAGPQVYTEEESAVLIGVCLDRYEKTGNPCYLAIMLNFCLNLRAGELVTLKYEDFDFDKHVLHVCRSEVLDRAYDGTGDKFRMAGYRVVDHLKAGHTDRQEVIDADTTPALVRWIRQQTGGGEYLFAYPDGRRVNAGTLSQAMRFANRAAGLEHRSNHKIRKTVLSRMIESRQFSTTEIMERAGHRDYHTTQKYYARPLPDATAPDRVSNIIPAAISEWAKMGENGRRI